MDVKMERLNKGAREGGVANLYRFTWVDVLINAFMAIFCVLVLIPMWYVLVISVSPYEIYVKDAFHLWPQGITFEEYGRALFSGAGIMGALLNSFMVTGMGTVMSLVMTLLGAYALCKKDLPFRGAIFRYIVLTMFISGGLVPSYILISKLHLKDTYLALTLPVCLSTYNMIIMKNYFTALPESLEESARIDGYNDFQILFKIIVPISKPMFAAIALFYAVGYWNDYFMCMLYISNNKMYTLQVVLRQMVIQNLVLAQLGVGRIATNSEQFKMACIIIGIVPVLIAYPMLQKYFSQGVMLGAVKE